MLSSALLAADPLSYDQMVSQYMAGKWDDLEKILKAHGKDPASFSIAQTSDIDYITKTLNECHPAWWDQLKTGKRTQVKASIFNVPVTAVYDPQQKQGLNIQFTGDEKTFTLGLVPGDMDSMQQAEHGFTKGEVGAGGIWSALGMASGYVQVPLSSMMNFGEADKLKLTRALNFRGDLAAAYYGNPRTRQWWLFLALHYYKPQYQKSPIVMSRKALGAMFVAELTANPGQYPSIKLPGDLDADHAEEKIAMSVQNQIEKHGWTFAADKQLRAAIKAFAIANASVIHTGGPVKLPNGLQISLDPNEDLTLQSKRSQWLCSSLQTNR